MIRALLRAWWISLSRDRVAQMMSFLLPIAFFSIFALVFGGQGGGSTARVRVAIVDEDGSATSRRLLRALRNEQGLRLLATARPRGAKRGAPEVAIDRARAGELVRDGDVPVALILPAGLDTSFARFGQAGGVAVELLSDPSDPVAPQVVSGLLQKAAMTAAPDLMAGRGFETIERFGGGLTPEQRRMTESILPMLRAQAERDLVLDSLRAADGDSTPAGGGGAMTGLVAVKVTEVVGEKRDNGMVAFYAAGIAVMFLMFSASAAGGSLLDEVESGTLDRVLGSRVGMTGLLAGKFAYLALLGIAQITVMFLWAMLAFGLNLAAHLAGFAVMTLATAACVAAFGLVLATACRTRAQLGGIATIVILCANAVGGSMFPRFLMSETMQKAGLVTPNAWALDGYVKVFWRDVPLAELAPQVAVLLAFAAAFLVLARLLARRWETA
jgi:ABC-2 type transport system permease protein